MMMRLFLAVAALAAFTSAEQSCPSTKGKCGSCPPDSDTNAFGKRLSPKAKVYYPCSEGFEQAEQRWSVRDAPDVDMVVVVGEEKDVDETVKFANARKKPFLAVTSTHGNIITQGRMKRGIEIRLHQLNSIELIKGGTEARLGGGTLSGQAMKTLWDAGKQTMTGASECVGVVGPGLGGGHGYLQGRLGLVGDQFTSLNMVLADGSRKTVDKHSDLFWAMNGAGHNFGIVTSLTMKVHDIQHRDWASAGFFFTGDKMEAVHDVLQNQILKDGKQDVDILTFSVITMVPDIDPKNPVIIQYVGQEGTKTVDPKYFDAFDKIGPVLKDVKSGIYTDIPEWIDDTVDSPGCQNTGAAHVRFPIELQSYNIEALRELYDTYAAGLQETPAFNKSILLIEGYPQQGVRNVPSDSTAYPFRDENIIVCPTLEYMPDGPALDAKAVEFGEKMRDIMHKGSGRKELLTYVNYAFGTETTQSTYGYAEWRQKKLKALKKKYDPEGKFSFYAPIA